MQKKLIALAIAGLASTAAFAQTNVTVYGVADGTFDVLKVDNASNIDQNAQTVNKGYFNRVAANSSYIGFKGTEDLGNGLKAVFQFESGVDFTDGASSTLATRDSFVGLSSDKFGTVVMGTLTGPSRALTAALDVNAGGTGNGSIHNMTGKLAGLRLTQPVSNLADPGGFTCAQGTGCASVFDTRWKNSIAYVSPTFSGFSFVGAYVADENKTTEVAAVSNSSPRRTTGYDTGLKYANGPWMAAVTYNWAQYGDVAGTTADNLRVGGMYNNGTWSVRAMWEETSLDVKNISGFNTKQQKWLIGGTYMVGKANLLAQYVQALDMDDLGGISGSGDSTGAQMAEIGVEYSLSKRTMLKTSYTWLKNEDNAFFDLGVNATGLNGGSGATIQGLSAGVRHTF